MNKKAQRILLDNFSNTIISRGNRYFRAGLIRNLQISNNFVSANVLGTEKYAVVVTFDEVLDTASMSCSCPYFEIDNCKHIVAVIYELEEKGFWDGRIEPIVSKKNSIKNQNIFSTLQKENILNRKLSSFIKKNEAAPQNTSNTEFRIAYSIATTYYSTEISPLRIRLRRDGTDASFGKAHSIDFDRIQKVDLSEKLIISYLLGYNNNIIYPSYNEKENVNKRKMFNDILTFLREKEVYLEKKYQNFSKVEILSEVAECKLLITEKDENIVLELELELFGEKIKLNEKVISILDSPVWMLIDDRIFKVNNLLIEQFEYFKDNNFEILIAKDYLDIFERNYLPKIASQLPIESDKYIVEDLKIAPTKKIFLEENDSNLILELKFGYGDVNFSYNPTELFTSIYSDGKIITIHRKKDFEDNCFEEIKCLYVKNVGAGKFTPRKDPIQFLFNHFEYFKEKGFEIFGEENLKKFKVNYSKPKVSFNVSSGIDWFDVTTEIDFGNATIPFSELVAAIKEKKNYLKLSDGSTGVLPEKWFKKIKQTISFGEVDNETVRFSKMQALALETIIEDADQFEVDDDFIEHIEKLKSFEKISKQTIPENFNGELRDYQKAGVDWLYFLKEYSFGGILADDMGLGKTIQSIILLLKEKSENNTSLIVAPTSVIFNWIDEIEKFSPSLKILDHTGIERERTDNSVFNNYDVVLSSYGVLLRDYELLSQVQFHYIILDESQKIKNPTSKTGRVVRSLNAKHRLCLTGTPIENNLAELWSQMAFLNPGLLGSFKNFNDSFVKPISKNNDDDSLNLLKRTIYPFILRRTKDVVALDLPEKTETIHFCEMEKSQEKVYKFWKNSIRLEILKEIDEKGIKKSGFKVMEGLLRLRQICNHPILVQKDYKKESSKFEEFKMMLEKVVAEGHKVLVFSQFVQMLALMKNHLDKNNIKYEYLTGSTRKRKEVVENFKKDNEIKVFLISLKAGGFGLNLTKADYVFHYDPWWNPAVEMQATDRTHRIGQNKNVFVYKFITKNSVEEKILLLQEKKKKLVKDIISTESSLLKNLTKKDIEILFEWIFIF